MLVSQTEFASGIVSLSVDYGKKRLNLTFTGPGVGGDPYAAKDSEKPARVHAEELIRQFIDAFEHARSSKTIRWLGI